MDLMNTKKEYAPENVRNFFSVFFFHLGVVRVQREI